ncbi:hypothetical protein BZG36_04764 [Bifiguratus adelaidae]|uniref:VWFA domain-containing protein n=1 Tax=Bifiguratus adelaidae TaxID=1938954 RepID=A0A261XVP4_9FUNG|nr:hypothetical protein BZG36_04764 [Bifiguratus adelaidae]
MTLSTQTSEAASALFCVKNGSALSPWLLSVMLQSEYRQDREDISLVQVTASRSHAQSPWALPSRTLPQKRRDGKKGVGVQLDIATGIDEEEGQPSKRYRITPHTRIFSYAKEQQIVFLVDISSSLGAIDPATGDVMFEAALKVLSNCIQGMVRPFAAQTSPKGGFIQPDIKINITIIVECAQFASNLNYIPYLANFPTLSVILQDVSVNGQNAHDIIAYVKRKLFGFQQLLADFRKHVRRERHKVEKDHYELDVGDRDVATQDIPDRYMSSTTGAKAGRDGGRTANKMTKEGEKLPRNAVQSPDRDEEEGQNKQKSSNEWGVGKTGSQLSYHLHAGLFALELLSKKAKGTVVLVTDGVNNSSFSDEQIVQTYTRRDIPVHVIQVGSNAGFVPAANFGFANDSEVLRFVATATGGTFAYGADCLSVAEIEGHAHSLRHTTSTVDNADINHVATGLETEPPHPVDVAKRSLPTISRTASAPHVAVRYPLKAQSQRNHGDTSSIVYAANFYHVNFLIRETILVRNKNENRYSGLKTELSRPLYASSDTPPVDQVRERYGLHSGRVEVDRSAGLLPAVFPWTLRSVPPSVDLTVIKYREGHFPARLFEAFVGARIRQGFRMHWIAFTDPNTEPLEDEVGATLKKQASNGDIKRDNSTSPSNAEEKPKVLRISFRMLWLPNVTVDYSVRASWKPNHGITGRVRTEIHVIAYTPFAQLFCNFHSVQRSKGRTFQGSKVYSQDRSDTSSLPLYSKVDKLHRFLSQTSELDDLLESWVADASGSSEADQASTMQPPKGIASDEPSLAISPKVTEREQSGNLTQFVAAWQNLEAHPIRAATECWYELASINLIITGVSPFVGLKTEDRQLHLFEQSESLTQSHVRTVHQRLAQWSHFKATDATTGGAAYVRRIMALEREPDMPSFCEVRIRREIGCFLNLRLLFFNVEAAERSRLMQSLLDTLDTESVAPRSSQDNVSASPELYAYLCSRPLHRLLLRDREHYRLASAKEFSTSTELSEIGKIKSWYMPSDMWLSSKYIAKNYLRGETWCWLMPMNNSAHLTANKLPAMHDVAFQRLCQSRLDDGAILVLNQPDRIQFYQEISQPDHVEAIAVQHFLWKDPEMGEIKTQLWMEPTQDLSLRSYFDAVAKAINFRDLSLISQIMTFDELHVMARRRERALIGASFLTNEHIPSEFRTDSRRKALYNILSVLTHGHLTLASYNTPVFTEIKHVDIEIDAIDETAPSGKAYDTIMPSAPGPSAKASAFEDKTSTKAPHRRISQSSRTASPIMHNPPATTTTAHMKADALKDKVKVGKEIIHSRVPRLHCQILLNELMATCLSKVTDGEVILEDVHLSGSFLKALREAVSQCEDGQAHLCAVHGVNRWKDFRCFVKAYDGRSLVALLLPKGGCLKRCPRAHERNPVAHNQDMSASDIAWGAFLFECSRMGIIKSEHMSHRRASASDLQDFTISHAPRIRFESIPAVISELDAIDNPIKPNLYKGVIDPGSVNMSATERTLRLVQDLDQLYNRNFARSVYAAMLHGQAVDGFDFQKMLDICIETSTEIGITDFLNVQVRARHGGNGLSNDKLDENFADIIAAQFSRVELFEGKPAGPIFYNKSLLRQSLSAFKREGQPMDEDVISKALAEACQNPLLLRLECVYTRVEPPESETHQVDLLPHAYPMPQDVWTPPVIGDEESPVKSVNGTKVVLRLIYITLPTMQADPFNAQIEPQAHMDAWEKPVDTFSAGRALPRIPMPNLTVGSQITVQQKADILDSHGRLMWYLTETILDGLMLLRPVTDAVFNYAEMELQTGCLYTNVPTTYSIPLAFVSLKEGMSKRESYQCFLGQLGRMSILPFHLRQVGNNFFVTGRNNMWQQIRHGDDDNDFKAEEHDIDLEGLGISLEKSTDSLPSIPETEEDTPEESVPFWLLVRTDQAHVQLLFYSRVDVSTGGRLGLMDTIREKVLDAQRRTNKVILLRHLQQTMECSQYLLQYDEGPAETSNSDNSSFEEDDPIAHDILKELSPSNSADNSLFHFGEFQCDRIYSKVFHLYPRLDAQNAIKLMPQFMGNTKAVRPSNLYVIRMEDEAKREVIVYCRLREGRSGSFNQGDATNTSEMKALSTQIHGDNRPVEATPQVRHTSSSLQPMSPKVGVRAQHSSEVILDIYGIDPLSPSLRNNVIAMFETPLQNRVVLPQVSSLFERNKTMKWTKMEMEFVFPNRRPAIKTPWKLREYIPNPTILLDYIKKALRSEQIRPIQDNVVAETLQERLTRSNHDVPSDPRRHACLYYNNLDSRHSTSSPTLEGSVGVGLAGIWLTIEGNAPYAEYPLSRESKSDERPAQQWINIQIWPMGNVNASALHLHVRRCFEHAVSNLMLDRTVTSFFNNGIEVWSDGYLRLSTEACMALRDAQGFLDPVLELLDHAATIKNLLVTKLAMSTDLAPWSFQECIKNLCSVVKKDHWAPPIVMKRSVDNSKEMMLVEAWPTAIDSGDNAKYYVVSGLQPLVQEVDKRGGGVHDRRKSHDSFNSGPSIPTRTHSRNNSADESRRSSTDKQSSLLHSSRATPISQHAAPTDTRITEIGPNMKNTDRFYRLDGPKVKVNAGSALLIISISCSSVEISTYKLSEEDATTLQSHVVAITKNHATRKYLLSNILHQKMGLFEHEVSFESSLASLSDKWHELYSQPGFGINSARSISPHKIFGSPQLARASPPGHMKTTSNLTAIAAATDEDNSASPLSDTRAMVTELVYAEFPTPTQTGYKESWKPKHGQSQNPSDRRTFDFNEVYRDTFGNTLSRYQYHEVADALTRHGEYFLEAYARHAPLEEAHEKALQIYLRWAAKYDSTKTSTVPVPAKLPMNDLRVVFRSSRLLHFGRTPCLITSSTDEQERPVPQSKNAEVDSKWFSSMVEQFMKDYASYLETLGMHIAFYGLLDSVEPNRYNYGEFNHKSDRNEYPSLYLIKVLRGGSIMCEVKIQDGFISVTLYSLHRQYGRLKKLRQEMSAQGSEGDQSDWHDFQTFMNECTHFKTKIHINSFVHDFQLRWIQQTTTMPRELQPNIDLVQVLNDFSVFHPYPCRYSRNRLLRGTYRPSRTEMRYKLFDYMLENPQRHGLGTVAQKGGKVALTYTTDFNHFVHPKQAEKLPMHPFKLTLIFGAVDTSDSLQIDYSLIATHMGSNKTGSIYVPRNNFRNINYPVEEPATKVLEVIRNELGNMLKVVEARIDAILNEAIVLYSQNSLWQSLREGRFQQSQYLLHTPLAEIPDLFDPCLQQKLETHSASRSSSTDEVDPFPFLLPSHFSCIDLTDAPSFLNSPLDVVQAFANTASVSSASETYPNWDDVMNQIERAYSHHTATPKTSWGIKSHQNSSQSISSLAGPSKRGMFPTKDDRPSYPLQPARSYRFTQRRYLLLYNPTSSNYMIALVLEQHVSAPSLKFLAVSRTKRTTQDFHPLDPVERDHLAHLTQLLSFILWKTHVCRDDEESH